ADKSQKKTKSVALQSTKTSSTALKAKLQDVEEESSPDEDFALFTRNFHKWTKLNKARAGRNERSKSSGYKDKK
ncbi:hypothetical protein A2U01_0103556, partial [Trifolium medium]|nr:hypothetical protein [Trifolium medium]